MRPAMSELGRERRFRDVRNESGSAPTLDILQHRGEPPLSATTVREPPIQGEIRRMRSGSGVLFCDVPRSVTQPYEFQMRRRDFIWIIGGLGATWPLAARAQKDGWMRRIGILWPYSEADPDSHPSMRNCENCAK